MTDFDNPVDPARLWPMMAGIWPAYDDYQSRTDRDIPVVLLEPVRQVEPG